MLRFNVKFINSNSFKYFYLNTIFNSIGAGIFEVLFSLYLISLGYNGSFVGLTYSVGTISLGLLSIPVGFISEKIGKKNSFIISRIISLVSLILLLLINNRISILINISLFNISQVFYLISAAPFIADIVSDENRVTVSSFVFSSSLFAVTLGNLIGGFLPFFIIKLFTAQINNSLSLRLSLLLYPLFLIFSLIFIMQIKSRSKSMNEDKLISLHSNRINLKNLSFLKNVKQIIIASVIVSFGVAFILPFFPIYFKLRFNASTQLIGLLFSLSNIPLAFATLLSGRIVRRLGMGKGIGICHLIGAPFTLLIGFPFNLSIISSSFVMRKILMNLYIPIWDNFFINRVNPENRGTALAINNFAISITGCIGAVLGGIFYTNNLLVYPFIIAAISVFIASLIYWNIKSIKY